MFEYIMLALLISFVISLLIALGFRAQLKTARKQQFASNYIRRGSFKLDHSRDKYLYSNTTKTKVRDSGR